MTSEAHEHRQWAWVGLGNPGARYARTRHNVGFRVVDAWRDRFHTPWVSVDGLFDVASGMIGEQTIRLIKPMTYMNRSGEAVVEVCREYRIGLSELVVIYDDIHLPLGALRLRGRGSEGGHNGLASIIQAVGSEEFPRQRLGIGMPHEGVSLIDYVLDVLPPDEETVMQDIVDRACTQLAALTTDGLERAASRYNGMTNM